MSHQYLGTWRIIEMEQWDQAFIDLVVPGYIAFRENHLSEFQFGAVHGEIDYRIEKYHDAERLECTWEGEDEMDPVSGRGWAIIQEGQLQGRIYFHEGDDCCVQKSVDTSRCPLLSMLSNAPAGSQVLTHQSFVS